MSAQSNQAIEVSQGPSSAVVMAKIWDRFEKQYHSKLKTRPSKSFYATQMGFTKNALSVWTKDGPDLRRRVPVGAIAALRKGLLMTDEEYDELMSSRLMELGAREEVVDLINWALGRVLDRDQGESFVVSAFRSCLPDFPRGLSFDVQEEALLHRFFKGLLRRAQEAQELEDRAEMHLQEQEGLSAAQTKVIRQESLGNLSAVFEQLKAARVEKDKWPKAVYRVALEEAAQVQRSRVAHRNRVNIT